MSRLFRVGFLAVLACGSSATTIIAATIGGEADAITRTPAVASFVVEAVDRAGNRQTLADGGWQSGATLGLTDISQTTVASLQLTASEANGSSVVWGAVPFAELGAFDGLTIPLFIQRKGDTARMPGTTEAGTGPFLAATTRAIYIAGDNTNVTTYDMLLLDAFGSCPVAAATKSFALVISPTPNSDGEQAMAWRIADDAASVMGLAQCTTGYEKFLSLDGGSSGSIAWSDFAGGRTVMGDDGSAYIVGPSRTNAPSSTIFKIAPDPEASTLVDALITSVALTPRKGAATAWAPSRGVFIYGGSSAAPNVVGEIVGAAGSVTEISGTDGGADAREDLTAIAFDNNKMLVAGDGQQPILVDLSCPGCLPQGWGMATNVKLTSPSLFTLGNGAFLLVGDDANTGATRLFRLSDSASAEKSLKIARQGARAIKFETGQIVIIGGGSATPESYAD